MPSRRIPDPPGEFERRLREVAQLRKLWRAFRDPQERREDEELSRPIVASGSSLPNVQEPVAAYGHRTILAALRYWWCRRDYAAMVALGDRLNQALLDEDPLVYVYLEAAKAQRSGTHDSRQAAAGSSQLEHTPGSLESGACPETQ